MTVLKMVGVGNGIMKFFFMYVLVWPKKVGIIVWKGVGTVKKKKGRNFSKIQVGVFFLNPGELYFKATPSNASQCQSQAWIWNRGVLNIMLMSNSQVGFF